MVFWSLDEKFEFLLVLKNGTIYDINFKAFGEIALSRLVLSNHGHIIHPWGFLKNSVIWAPPQRL